MWLKKTYNLLILMLILGCIPVKGQDRFTLQELIHRTLQENYQLQIIQNQEQMSQNLNTAGNAGMLPLLGIASEATREVMTSEAQLFTGEVRRGDNAVSTGFNAMAEVDWIVFDGFSMFARRDRLGHLATLGSLETKYFIEQTVADLAIIYYQLIKEQQVLDAFLQLKEVSAFRLQLEARKRSVGSGSALLYHQALVDFNADSALVLNQQMLVRDQQIQINRIVNRNPLLPLLPAEERITLQGIGQTEELIERSVNNNRDLERSRLEEMLAEANVRIERGARYPQVSLFGNYSYSQQTSELGIIESAKSHGARFGVRLRLNLYDGGRQSTQVDNVLLEQQSAGIHREDIRALIEADLARLINRYQAYNNQYFLLEESLQAAGRSMIIAREQLQTGTINGYEFRQTQLAALQVENQLIELQYALKAIEIDIFRISGTLLDKSLI